MSSSCGKEPLTSTRILENSITYHDPDGEWGKLQVELEFNEVSADSSKRNTWFIIDQPNQSYKLNRNHLEIHGVKKDSCFIEKGDFSCDRAVMMKNYYTYLWGLPMKLLDPGTKLSEDYEISTWEGVEVYALAVDYEKDDWIYYFDKKNFRLVGYEFTQTNGNIEKIILKGEVSFNNWKIPASRSWFNTSDNSRFLGTDHLVGVKQLD